jgi:hypothetical protein
MKMSEVASLVLDAATPWYLTSGELNVGEEAELERIRALGDAQIAARARASAKSQPKSTLRATVPVSDEGKQMAKYAAVASRAAKAVGKYGPSVYETANAALASVSGGKVKDVADIGQYVGNNPGRLKVASEALLRSGVMLGDVLPRDLVGTDQNLIAIRASAEKLVSNLQAQFLAGSDRSLVQGVDGVAADVLRKKRVKAVLGTYGSEENYFLCHPGGGVPAEDFAWYRAVVAR